MESQARTIRIHNWSLLMLIFVTAALSGCGTGPSHPPSFADFQRARRHDSEESFDAQVAVLKAAHLSKEEMLIIMARGRPNELIGAGILAPLGDLSGNKSLLLATQKSPNDPAAWAAIAYRELSLLRNRAEEALAAEASFGKAIKELRSIDPTNSAPWYLEAAFQCRQTNYSAARILLVGAARMGGFATYNTELKKCIVEALESVGYSKYTARMVACGHASGIVEWSNLSKVISKEWPEDREAIRSCFLLGSRLGEKSSFLEELIGYSIQTRTMDKLTGSDFATERARIAERKARIKVAAEYLNSANKGKITEERWVQYFNESFDTSEMIAIESLASDQGKTF